MTETQSPDSATLKQASETFTGAVAVGGVSAVSLWFAVWLYIGAPTPGFPDAPVWAFPLILSVLAFAVFAVALYGVDTRTGPYSTPTDGLADLAEDTDH